MDIGGVELGAGVFGQLRKLTMSWQFWLGVLALLVVMVITLDLYSSEELSRVVPMFSLSYVLVALVGHFYLGEAVGAMRWLGIALIISGVVVMVRS
jgi:drug/metabolite transporter (DMT)-like permease